MFILFILYGISAFVFGMGIYLWWVLAVTSPIGAFMCCNSARRRGRNATRHALAGALYWTCWFLPWIYFLYWNDGREAPSWLVKAGYGLLFTTWLAGPVGGGFFLADAGSDLLRAWMILVACVNLIGVMASVKILISTDWPRPHGEYPSVVGIVPFGLAAVGTALYLPFVVYLFIAG